MRKRAERLLTPMMVQNEKIKNVAVFLVFLVLSFVGVFLYIRNGAFAW